jgi:hypothetical protein
MNGLARNPRGIIDPNDNEVPSPKLFKLIKEKLKNLEEIKLRMSKCIIVTKYMKDILGTAHGDS